jgi:hypothetical protein
MAFMAWSHPSKSPLNPHLHDQTGRCSTGPGWAGQALPTALLTCLVALFPLSSGSTWTTIPEPKPSLTS